MKIKNSKKAEVIFNGTKKIFNISKELEDIYEILQLLCTINIPDEFFDRIIKLKGKKDNKSEINKR